MTPFGYVAAAAAYGDAECEVWRQSLVRYLRSNRDAATAALRQMGVRFVAPESSYLLWIDATDVLPWAGANAEAFFREAGVGLTGGVSFGGRPGTCRLNFGCTRATLEEGLARMAAAIAAARPP